MIDLEINSHMNIDQIDNTIEAVQKQIQESKDFIMHLKTLRDSMESFHNQLEVTREKRWMKAFNEQNPGG